jgi:RNA polymerase sigma-70 factor (ECF subfamily)
VAEEHSFAELLRRVRSGDEQAAAEMVRLYEPAIRREVRRRLTDARVRRVLDASDVCQLVLKSFFVRAALGQFELESSSQLLALLARMARNKLADEAKKEWREQRGGKLRRASLAQDSESGGEVQLAASQASPSQEVAGADLLQQALARFGSEERQIAELKGHGHLWPEIAARLGGSPEARRKQYERAVERVARELQIDGLGDE